MVCVALAGYKSGMSFIAGALLGEMDREDAFWCFCAIIATRAAHSDLWLPQKVPQQLEATCPLLQERMLPPGIFEDGSRARFEEVGSSVKSPALVHKSFWLLPVGDVVVVAVVVVVG